MDDGDASFVVNAVYWLEQTENDVPAEDRWLSAREQSCLGEMRFAKRRADWRLGRWTVKHAVAACLHLSADADALSDIEVKAVASGAPGVFLHGQPAPVAISLSHRAGVALCTVGLPETSFGCDLETVEPHGEAFVADYFTDSEKKLIEDAPTQDRTQLIALLWSAKESVLKALRVGLRADTKSVSVSSVDAGLLTVPIEWRSFRGTGSVDWRPLRAIYSGTQDFYGWWRVQGQLLRTLATDAPLGPPASILLTHSAPLPHKGRQSACDSALQSPCGGVSGWE